MSRIIILAALCASAAVLGVAAWLLISRSDDRFAQCRETSVAGGSAAIGGPFTLTRQDGVRVTEAEVITGPTLIYFGYTFCPDVCPIDMARNAQVVDMVRERGEEVDAVMISVDPERDTPDVIGEYVSWMHEDAIGLTGSVEDIEAVKGAYRVFAAKSGDTSGDEYLVDHSTFTYLMAPEEGLLEFFRRDDTAEEMATRVACFAERL